ncbi:unnamed protein product [Rotaria socialis]
MPTYTHSGKYLYEIWLFYANIIGYIRLILIIASVTGASAAIHQNSFDWAIFASFCNYTGGWLLDWIDGPLARKYQQCTVFGACFDWYCDLLAELVFIVWAAELRLWISLWMLIILALELGSGLIDTNNVAANYPWTEFAPKSGFSFRILQIVFPKGHYSKIGTAVWILHATWAFCYIILAHIPAHYLYLAAIIHGLSILLLPVALCYALHQIAYMIVLVSGWKEPARGTPE